MANESAEADMKADADAAGTTDAGAWPRGRNPWEPDAGRAAAALETMLAAGSIGDWGYFIGIYDEMNGTAYSNRKGDVLERIRLILDGIAKGHDHAANPGGDDGLDGVARYALDGLIIYHWSDAYMRESGMRYEDPDLEALDKLIW